MNTKTFLTSKINWLGILLIVAGLSEYKDMIPAEWAKFVLCASGIATLILRTFYTSKPIAAKSQDGRATPLALILTAILAASVALSLVSCASTVVTSGAEERLPLEQAKLQYAAATLDYEAFMLSGADLCRTETLKKEQCAALVTLQAEVQRWAPAVRSSLNLWESTGTKPSTFDEAQRRVVNSVADVKRIVQAAKGGGQ